MSFFPSESYKRTFPYHARSPSLKQRVEYKNEEGILEEIERILQRSDTKKFGIGQVLYYDCSIFCDVHSLVPEWCWEMLEDYNSCKKFNIPLASSLDEVSAWMVDCFNVIESEITNCTKHQKEKDG